MCTFSGNVAYAGFVAYGHSIYVSEDGSDGTDGSVSLSACVLATDQSVYVHTGGSIVHHSGCPANTSLAGSVDLSETVECTDSSSTWCLSSVLVADLLTNGEFVLPSPIPFFLIFFFFLNSSKLTSLIKMSFQQHALSADLGRFLVVGQRIVKHLLEYVLVIIALHLIRLHLQLLFRHCRVICPRRCLQWHLQPLISPWSH